MTVGPEQFTPSDARQDDVSGYQANAATYTLQNDKKGHYYHHPQQGRIRVVALFCNCGRSILVRPKEVKSSTITCNQCDSAFRWQQLSFAVD